MKKKNFNKGFTLIELLVVIAIIGILSSVVLANLSTARLKGVDAALKADMSGMRSQAEIVFNNDGDYDAVCGANSITQNDKVKSQLESASQASLGNTTSYMCGMPASGVATAWAATVPMRSQDLFGTGSGVDYWCVDSAGVSKLIDNNIGANDTVCP